MNTQTTPIKIVYQGAVRINSAVIEHKSPDIVCIAVDFSTKYAEYNSHGGGDGSAPEVWYGTSEYTIKLNEKVDRETPTGISFPDFVGWNVYCASSPGRYTASVVLVKPKSIDE